MPFTLGIDVGTSGVRAVLLDARGMVRAEASHPLAQQSATAWWSGCEQVLDRLDLSRVAALAIDATSSTVLRCTADGEPLPPVLMYSDLRATAEAERIAEQVPPDSGAHGAGSSLAKWLWLAAHQPAASGSRLLHQADWLTGHFLGRYDCTDENNALKLGYDAVTRRWPGWLAALGVEMLDLPRVYPPGHCLGPVCEPVRDRFGLGRDCQVAAGTTDSTAACLAAGISEPGDAVSVLGSTLVLKVLAEQPVFAPEYGVYSHRLGDHWLVGGASNSGGAVLRCYFTDPELESLSREIDPGRDSGLDYYPLMSPGERFPHNDPALAPRLTPRPASDSAFLHGLLEGIARVEQAGYARLAALGAPAVQRVFSLGGGATNPTWTRLRQRLLGVPLLPARHTQAAAGAALLAGQCLQSAGK